MVGAALLVADGVLTPFYENNDDVAMRMIASGSYSPVYGPSEFLLYINVLWAKGLVQLYGLFPGIPWYDVCLLLASIAAGLVVVRMTCKGPVGPIATAAYCLTFLMVFFVRPEFTGVGMLVAASAYLLACSIAMHPPQRRIRRIGALAYVSGALFVSGLIRKEALFGVTLFAVPAALPLLIARGVRRDMIASAASIALGLALAFGASGLHERYYRNSPGFSHLSEFYRLASNLWVYDDLFRVEDPGPLERDLAELGWTLNDYSMFRSYFFSDLDVFSLDRVRSVSNHFDMGSLAHKWRRLRPRHLAESILENLRNVRPYLLTVLLLGLLFQSRRCFFYAVFLCSMLLAILVGCEVMLKRPPFRVFFGLSATAAAFTILAGRAWGSQRRDLRSRVPAIGVLALTSFALFLEEAARSHRLVERSLRVSAYLAQSVEKDRETVVAWGGNFPYRFWLRPFRSMPDPARIRLIPIDIWGRTPIGRDTLRNAGIESLARALCTRSDLLLAAWDRNGRTLIEFVREHYGMRVHLEVVIRNDSLSLLRCVAEEPEDRAHPPPPIG
jgi:hypothetical protein